MAVKRCGTCNGAGTRKVYEREGNRNVEKRIPCPGECKGQGWIAVPDKR